MERWQLSDIETDKVVNTAKSLQIQKPPPAPSKLEKNCFFCHSERSKKSVCLTRFLAYARNDVFVTFCTLCVYFVSFVVKYF